MRFSTLISSLLNYKLGISIFFFLLYHIRKNENRNSFTARFSFVFVVFTDVDSIPHRV